MRGNKAFSIPIKNLPVAFLLTDLKGKMLFINKKALSILGYKSSSEIQSKTFFDLVPSHERKDFIHIYQSIFKNKLKKPLIVSLIKKKGMLTEFEFNYSLMKEKPSLMGIILIELQSKKNKVPENLEYLENFYQATNAVINNAGIGIIH